MKSSDWLLVPVAALMIPASSAYATVYMTLEQAQQAIFPGVTFTANPLTITDAQAAAIQKRSGVDVRNKNLQIWRGSNGAFVFLDQVIGKHEFIDVAWGVNADGTMKDYQILQYKETYGYQVKDADWRSQFAGKTAASPLQLGQDVKNISGATLSCKHMADGAKRILTTYAVLTNK